MSDSKPSTNDILAKIRAQKAAAAGDADEAPAAAAPAPEEASAAPAPAGTADILASIRGGGAGAKPAAAKPAAAPAGTADILASIRGGGAGAKPADAKPAAAPTGTADIMASIRGGGAGAKPAAAKPAAAKGKPAAAAKADTAAAAGMSPAEMIRAARSAKEGTAAKPAVVLPSRPLPGKLPAAPKADVQRRSFLSAVTATICTPIMIAWASFGATAAASGLALARFMMPNVLVEPPTKFKIGPPTDYAPGMVSTKWQAQFNIWVVNDTVDGVSCIYALSTVCTHLGCTPNWLEGEQKFKCPCHGSGFYKTGINFEGPAPRPLERVGLRLAEDGMLEVDKSVKFQRELGQWANPSSFVGVG